MQASKNGNRAKANDILTVSEVHGGSMSQNSLGLESLTTRLASTLQAEQNVLDNISSAKASDYLYFAIEERLQMSAVRLYHL